LEGVLRGRRQNPAAVRQHEPDLLASIVKFQSCRQPCPRTESTKLGR
jgi:hypothetical protein